MTVSLFEMISLGLYFILMVVIGLYAYRKSTGDVSEYMLGNRQLHPAVGALSAGASDMSGWILMGLPGAVFLGGVEAAWIVVGLLTGAYLNYRFVAPRLRVYTEMANDSITIPDFLENRFADTSHALRIISALVIIVFFTLYTSAGIVAGGKLFEASFGLNYYTGLFVTAGVVLAYTVIGGFLAVSLTDFVQGSIMFIALIIVPVVALVTIGGFNGLEANIAAAAPGIQSDGSPGPDRSGFFDWTKNATLLGTISLLSWGLGYFGQPHIIVRFMAIRSLGDIATARLIGMVWMAITLTGAVFVGIVGVAYVQSNNLQGVLEDPETIFILLSQLLFHPFIAGFLLAAILAAIMSTISSQLLVSSSSLTEDLYKTFIRTTASQSELVLVGRLATIGVCLVAIALAFDRSSNILSLVSNAWAGFGAAFGPVILLSLFWSKLTRDGALFGMVSGAITVLFWLYAPVTIDGQSLSSIVYEIIPGFIIAALAAIFISLFGRNLPANVQQKHAELNRIMSEST